MPLKVGRNSLGKMGIKDCCHWRLEATTLSGIWYLFGQVNLTFFREKSGNFES